MKELILFSMLMFGFYTNHAQEVVATAGETKKAGNIELSWTLGEPVIATLSEGSNQLTQGFHQTKLVVTALNELNMAELELKVYPNPTSDFVIVHLNTTEIRSRFTLFDIAGKILSQNRITETDTQLNMLNYASGTYVLKVFNDKEQPIQSFKIVKR